MRDFLRSQSLAQPSLQQQKCFLLLYNASTFEFRFSGDEKELNWGWLEPVARWRCETEASSYSLEGEHIQVAVVNRYSVLQ